MRHDEQNNESMLPRHLAQTTRDFYTILPNIMAPIIVSFSVTVPGVILTEAALRLPWLWHTCLDFQLGRYGVRVKKGSRCKK